MAKKKTSSSKTTGSYIGWGVGLGVTAAAAASAYFLYGTKEGQKQRKKVRGWMVKMKGEVLEKMEQAKDLNEKKYQEIIDAVAGKYQKLKTVEQSEVKAVVSDLKKHWRNIKRHLEDQPRKTTSTKKKTATKKTAKKKTATKKSTAARKKS